MDGWQTSKPVSEFFDRIQVTFLMSSISEGRFRAFPPVQRKVLIGVRDVIQEILPGAQEGIAWGMPAFKNKGVTFICFQGFADHNSIFPMSESVLNRLKKELANHVVSKGAIHFDLEKAISRSLLRKIIEMRIAEINDSYPTRSGEYLHFYANGHLQSRGHYRGGTMHGKWHWYRKDGSLMRSGQFDEGEQAGTWVTFDRSGREVKTTRF